MIPLNPAYLRTLVVELWCTVEVRSLADNFHSLIMRIDKCNSVLNRITGMFLLNREYQIRMKRVDVEVSISKILGSVQEMAKVLKEGGREVKLVIFEGEGHGFRMQKNVKASFLEEEALWRRTLLRLEQ